MTYEFIRERHRCCCIAVLSVQLNVWRSQGADEQQLNNRFSSTTILDLLHQFFNDLSAGCCSPTTNTVLFHPYSSYYATFRLVSAKLDTKHVALVNNIKLIVNNALARVEGDHSVCVVYACNKGQKERDCCW